MYNAIDLIKRHLILHETCTVETNQPKMYICIIYLPQEPHVVSRLAAS